MLNRINQIDWASRNAQKVPIWLQQLASDEKDLARNAYEHLSRDIIKLVREDYDDGTGISDILETDTPLLIVPFLVEILTMEKVANKAHILGMLTLMTGYVELDFEGKLFEERAQRIHEAIWDGYEIYLNLLDHSESSVRSQVVSLICQFHNHSDDILPHVRRAIAKEKVSEAKKWMIKQFKDNFPKESLNARQS